MDDKVQFVVTAADWDDNFDQVIHINPFTLRMAKTGLTILEMSIRQKHFLENV